MRTEFDPFQFKESFPESYPLVCQILNFGIKEKRVRVKKSDLPSLKFGYDLHQVMRHLKISGFVMDYLIYGDEIHITFYGALFGYLKYNTIYRRHKRHFFSFDYKDTPVVYILVDELKRCKIGFTSNLHNRFLQHKTSNPFLKIIRVYHGDMDVEKYVHEMFAQKRIKRTKEWFNLTRSDIELLDKKLERLPNAAIPYEFLWRKEAS